MSEGRRSSVGSGSESATRLSRVEERETLHNLNSRLQYFLSRMKELEARNGELQAKVDTGSAAAKSHNDSMRAVYERELAELRAAQENDVELIAELKARAAANAAQAAESAKVAAASRKKAERCDDAEARLRLVTEERDRALVAGKDAAERAEKASQAAAVAESKASLLEKKLAPLREQLATAEELRRKEAATFRETIDELTGANRGELARMQAAYDAQLQDALEAAKRRADEERKAELEQLAAHFQTVEAELSREAGEERAAKESALARAAELGASVSEARERAGTAERRAAEIERELGAHKRKDEQALVSLRQQLEDARAARKEKEAEFNELMDVKISLDEELKTYRCLIEGEEERLGITPTQDRALKRRRVAAGPAPYISQLDLLNDCVTVKNAGDEVCALGGYKLQSVHSTEVSFTFPAEFEILPGAAVTVWSGKKNQRRRRDPQTELWWSPRYMWNDEGDMAILHDPSGGEVSKLEAAAKTVADAPEPGGGAADDGAGARAGGERQCAVM
ncbi:hypothetical protein KFE25_006612 [Diacronema lutheri]|uniref:IF rod domain-containing protein n=2 Tax=Diacronema lutheri TaxID=2081491 RepID=A0A8J5X658_DIALT|nr:hypothetical protein KFE25_006612 [Diacronema lutheri]